MTKRSYLASFFVALMLALGLSSVAFADEANSSIASSDNTGAIASESANVSRSADAGKLEIVNYNNVNPSGTFIQLGDRLNVRVKGASSDEIIWTSLNPDRVQVASGSAGGFSSNEECTLIAIGYGASTIRVTCGDLSSEIRIHVGHRDPVDFTNGYAWTGPSSYTYTGSEITPEVTIVGQTYELTSNGLSQGYGKLKEGVDYKVTYSNNIQVGTAKMTVEGIGFYTGTKSFEFTINPVPSVEDTAGNNPDSSDSSGSMDEIINVGPNTPTNINEVKPKPAPQAPAVAGSWKKSHGKWWFSYDSSSVATQGKPWPANEWVNIEGKRYHFNGSGYMNSGWYKSGNDWYYLGSDGAMKTGWQKVKKTWYFMGSNGIMLTGKLSIEGQVYFLNSSGAMKTGWNKESGTWYYYKSSGAMATGWQKVKGKWYFLDQSTGAMKTGWLDDSGSRYYLDGNGAMYTGWHKISNQWYYFNKSGAMQTNKWIGNYYVQSDGVMATNTWIGKYHVNGSGKWDRTR